MLPLLTHMSTHVGARATGQSTIRDVQIACVISSSPTCAAHSSQQPQPQQRQQKQERQQQQHEQQQQQQQQQQRGNPGRTRDEDRISTL